MFASPIEGSKVAKSPRSCYHKTFEERFFADLELESEWYNELHASLKCNNFSALYPFQVKNCWNINGAWLNMH